MKYKGFTRGATIGLMGLISACSTFQNPQPNLLGEYPSISSKSTDLLEKDRDKLNIEIVSFLIIIQKKEKIVSL